MNQVAKEAPPALTTRPGENGSGAGDGDGSGSPADDFADSGPSEQGAEPSSERLPSLGAEPAPKADAGRELESYESGEHRLDVDELELSALSWRRFAGVGSLEVVELVAIGPKGLQTAYARGEREYLRLARAGDQLSAHGIFQVANPLSSRVHPLCKTGSWAQRVRRADDSWISERRVLGIDVDPVRPAGESATDDEWGACVEVADNLKRYLVKHVPVSSLATGSSGNGVWVFIALQRAPKAPSDSERISAFLKALNKRFGKEGKVKIDSSVGNPARLVPLWGTMKRKGSGTPDRPHRQTTFCSASSIERVPLSTLIG